MHLASFSCFIGKYDLELLSDLAKVTQLISDNSTDTQISLSTPPLPGQHHPVYHAAYSISIWKCLLEQHINPAPTFHQILSFGQRLRPARIHLEGCVGAGDLGRFWWGTEAAVLRLP